MAYLDRSTMDHLGSALRPEYDLVVTSPVTRKHRDLLFQYTLAEASVGAERGSREARLRLRERGGRICSAAAGATKRDHLRLHVVCETDSTCPP